MTHREQMREMGVSDAIHYASMDPGFPSVTGGFVIIDDPLPPGVRARFGGLSD